MVYYGIIKFLYNLFMENKDAIIALPTPVKTIIIAALVYMIGSGVIKKMISLLSIAIIIAILYFGAVYLGFV